MGALDLLTPEALALSLAVVPALGALAFVERRARAVRGVLGLAEPPSRSAISVAAALIGTAALLALAAAQPVIAHSETRLLRAGVEAIVVLDSSRSMLAASERDGETRFDRARAAAARLRASVPDVRVGLASLTDRVVPHVLPTGDLQVYAAALERSVGIERPPPVTRTKRATSFSALTELAQANYFTFQARRRVAIVFTDGEGQDEDPNSLRSTLPQGVPLTLFLVHVWKADERVFDENGRPEPQYRADPQSRKLLDEIPIELGITGSDFTARVFAEDEDDALRDAFRDAVSTGERRAEGESGRRFALAPYSAAASFVPLAWLLWRRNRA